MDWGKNKALEQEANRMAAGPASEEKRKTPAEAPQGTLFDQTKLESTEESRT
jgi:hypothetical protein